MTQDEIRKAIIQAFKTGWEAANGLPVRYPNQPFSQPTGAPWAVLSLKPADRFDGSVGTGHVRDLGIVWLQIFAPENTGIKTATDAAHLFSQIMDNRTLTPLVGGIIQTHRVKVEHIGQTQGGFYQVNASVDYRADHFQ